jgi:hypothetical protein
MQIHIFHRQYLLLIIRLYRFKEKSFREVNSLCDFILLFFIYQLILILAYLNKQPSRHYDRKWGVS